MGNKDKIKKIHEKSTGNNFIKWFNRRNKTNYTFEKFDSNPPDLLYKDQNKKLYLEITTAYYDEKNAIVKWSNARDLKNILTEYSGSSLDSNLINFIQERINEKCNQSLIESCLLVININPGLTSAKEIQENIGLLKIPKKNPYMGIYLAGTFPTSQDSTSGYYCWTLCIL